MKMSREEYDQREGEILEYFAPGKKIKMAEIYVWMMVVDSRGGIRHDPVANIKPEQIPIIQCVYTNKNGNLMEVCIEWADLEALRVMNNETPLEKPPTTEYVDRG